MSQEELQDKMAAALNHQITDEKGEVIEEATPTEEPAAQEQTEPVKEEQPQEDTDEPVEDEQGKRYVPESRFKEVYAKRKEAERRALELEEQLKQLNRPEPSNIPTKSPRPADRAEALENELLFTKYPQFDPTSPQFDRNLDEYAGDIYAAAISRGNVITKLEAARIALDRTRKLASNEASIREEARAIKKATVTPMTSRGGQRVEPQVDPDHMSAKEMESYLKSQGAW